ncbi:sialidase family protein [Sulfuricella sp.]|uniref:sialidase family protein n=1 Tax=Sulfuricella sp. TaxID=2099377 RepID=UPI002C3E33D3|nr:sialidase family protein [Sulfuricella sp.]HUX62573.1 sialidase family protein [Sulfuricella sp.]
MGLVSVFAADKPQAHDMGKMWQASLARPALSVGSSFDPRGRLWLAKVESGYLFVSHSEDKGKTFGPAVKVNSVPEKIAADGENRPKIMVTPEGRVYVAYTSSLEIPFSGHIRFSRSTDGGTTFSEPLTVNDNREVISHRFEAMAVDSRGQVTLAWLDKRDQSAAQRHGQAYAGAAVYYAVSTDGGASFGANRKLADNSCECCRVAMAMDQGDVPVVFWRHVYGKNVRDHALVRLDGKSQPVRVSYDQWEVDACPHHGPAISIADDGAYHLVWFDNGPKLHGLFYASSADQGKTFSAPKAFGNFEAQAGHPHVLSFGKAVHVVWKEFDGQNLVIRGMSSADGGKSWSLPRQIATTAGASDHPLLVADGTQPYLSWNTAKEGFRLIGVAP